MNSIRDVYAGHTCSYASAVGFYFIFLKSGIENIHRRFCRTCCCVEGVAVFTDNSLLGFFETF